MEERKLRNSFCPKKYSSLRARQQNAPETLRALLEQIRNGVGPKKSPLTKRATGRPGTGILFYNKEERPREDSRPGRYLSLKQQRGQCMSAKVRWSDRHRKKVTDTFLYCVYKKL
jgi:hypothetical protein